MPDAIIKPKAKPFYKELLEKLNESKIPYMVAGTFAFSYYTGIVRKTKDLDVFCKAGDYPRLLKYLADQGFKTEVTDERWIAKAIYGNYFADVIWGVVNSIWTVDDTWLSPAPTAKIFDIDVRLVPPEELLWTKVFRNDRNRSDIADVHHIILKKGKDFDWRRLLTRMEQHWEVLLSVLVMFRFIYPSERDTVPKWLMDELISRIKYQSNVPIPKERVSRGHLFSNTDYDVDISQWGYLNT